MTLPLDQDPRPPYVQAADVLRAAIRDGELRPGARLPSARELQRRFGIASSTVQNALRLLKEEGLIYSVLGRGSYVRAQDSETEPKEEEAAADEPDPAYVGLGDLRRGWQAAPSDDPRPPYVQTADALRKQIQDGRLAPGAKLPSARELQEQFGIANSTAQNALRVLKEEGLIYSVQGRGVFVRQLSPREQFLKRYNESLEQSAAQGRADEEAVRFSGKTDDEVAAELEAAEERFAKASVEFEAATAHRDAMRAVMEQRKRLSGNYTPEEKAAKAQLLRDRLAEARRRR
ncbi:GntR family transcriptional regulator [Streptomyces viridochromogenes]|uniref:Putative GntR family transcriptional regulator n=1 Tax=Streptomyces viridochromogenes Tue57 TaxID=1160705 RepID=L8PBU1_STRVR|nr:GntR family transcriptional regulator [Streptomyces viridochromogenes]ELS53629.1 putative GntR family transcriptional regulator [Streptomyces viridochromogenes Tue57]